MVGEGKEHQIFIEKIKRKRLFRRYEAWAEGEAYIKIYIEETGWKCLD
jgi:hypothetical protein